MEGLAGKYDGGYQHIGDERFDGDVKLDVRADKTFYCWRRIDHDRDHYEETEYNGTWELHGSELRIVPRPFDFLTDFVVSTNMLSFTIQHHLSYATPKEQKKIHLRKPADP